jgi:tetratricopeptide (TPR) repeat protein
MSPHRLRLLLLVLLALAALPSRGARAGDDSDAARARAHADVGMALYKRGEWAAALREFASGHQLAPRPEFLLNMGQCYRKLKQPKLAYDSYRQFLSDPLSDDRLRPTVERMMREVEVELAATTPPPGLAAPPSLAAPPATAPPSAPPAPQPRAHRWRKQLAWIVPVGAVVVGVSVGLGVYFGTRDCGCIDFTRQ